MKTGEILNIRGNKEYFLEKTELENGQERILTISKIEVKEKGLKMSYHYLLGSEQNEDGGGWIYYKTKDYKDISKLIKKNSAKIIYQIEFSFLAPTYRKIHGDSWKELK